MNVFAIDHIVLRVADLPRAVRFYAEVLGCAIERERPELGMVHLRIGDSLIDLVATDGAIGALGGAAPSAQGRNLDHLCLRVREFDVDRVTAELQAAGVAVGQIERRYGATGEALSVYARDPDGNGLEIRA